MWCLAEGSALQQRSDTDLCPRLQDILVLVPYLCSHLGCSSQCFPWLPFLFAFPGREFSGPRAWFSLVFVLCLGCHSCKQSQRVINHLRIEPRPFPTKVTGRPMPMWTQEGSGYVPPAGCRHASCSIQPSPLLSGSSSAYDPTNVPAVEGRSPCCLAKCVRGGSLPLPCDVPDGDAGAGAAAEGSAVGRHRES